MLGFSRGAYQVRAIAAMIEKVRYHRIPYFVAIDVVDHRLGCYMPGTKNRYPCSCPALNCDDITAYPSFTVRMNCMRISRRGREAGRTETSWLSTLRRHFQGPTSESILWVLGMFFGCPRCFTGGDGLSQGHSLVGWGCQGKALTLDRFMRTHLFLSPCSCS